MSNREKNPTNNLQFLELNKDNEQINSRNSRINREKKSPILVPMMTGL